MTAFGQDADSAMPDLGSRLPHPQPARDTSASSLAPPPPRPGRPAPVPPPPPVIETAEYQSVRGLGRALQVLMVAWALLAGLAAGATWRASRMLNEFEANPLAITPEDLVRIDERAGLFALIQAVVFVAIAVIFAVWFRRMYVNLSAFGERSVPHSAGWAVGGWFVPLLNFVRPKEIADEIWRRSAPDRSRPGAQPGLSTERVPKLVHWWWGIYIVAGFSAWTAGVGQASDSVSAATTRANWWLIGDLLQIALGAVTFLVVAMFVDRQERRARFIAAQVEVAASATPISAVAPPVEPAPADGPDIEIPAEASWNPRLVWVGGALVASIAAIVLSASLIDGPSDGQTVLGTATTVHDLTAGDCFDFPDSVDRTDFQNAQDILAVDVVACDTAHGGEVVGTAWWTGAGSRYPGDAEALMGATLLCVEPVQEYLGASFLEGGVDVFVVVPDRLRWANGDRSVTCMATSLDGQSSLNWSLRDAGTALADDERTWWSLETGDCFDEPEDPLATTMDLVPCDAPHDYETFAVVAHPGDQHPGNTEIVEWAEAACADVYPEVVDREKSSGIDYGFGGAPIAESWSGGHRAVTCVLWNRFGQLSESVLLD